MPLRAGPRDPAAGLLAFLSWPQHEPLVAGFSWQPGTPPASSRAIVVGSIASYLSIILLLKLLVKKPLGINKIQAVHNLILCVLSLIMFVGGLQAALVESYENQWMWGGKSKYTWILCFPPGTRSVGRVFFWSYIYYLSKFYELIDTLLLVLKNKPLTFLHVYHHATVVVMCYLWLEGQQSLQVIAMLTNTGIHVIMYFYYFMHSIGMPPPWRKFVTNGQIIQFLFSFVASLPFLWLHFTSKHGGCAGFSAWLFNAAFNLSLLLLFINFHQQQYGRQWREKQKGA